MSQLRTQMLAACLTARLWVFSFAQTALEVTFKDSIRGFLYFAQKSKSGYKEDAETKEIIRQFYVEYLDKGWALIMSCIRSIMIAIYIYALMFIRQSNQYYKLTVVEWPFLFAIVAILDKLFQKYAKWREIILMVMILFLGSTMIYRNYWRTTFSLYENWISNLSFFQYSCILMWLNIKWAIIPYFIVVIWYRDLIVEYKSIML